MPRPSPTPIPTFKASVVPEELSFWFELEADMADDEVVGNDVEKVAVELAIVLLLACVKLTAYDEKFPSPFRSNIHVNRIGEFG